MSDNISQLTGSTLYFPVAAIFFTSSKLGETLMVITSCFPANKKTPLTFSLSKEFIESKTSLTESYNSVKDE